MFVIHFNDLFNSDESATKLYNITTQCISYIQENVTLKNAAEFGMSKHLLERLENYQGIQIKTNGNRLSPLCGIEYSSDPHPSDPICLTFNAFEMPKYTNQEQAKIIFHELPHIDTHHPENLSQTMAKSFTTTAGKMIALPILALGIVGDQIAVLHHATDALRIGAALWGGYHFDKLRIANALQKTEYAADAFSDFMMPHIKMGDMLQKIHDNAPQPQPKTSWLMDQFSTHPTLVKRQKASNKNVIRGEKLHKKHNLPAFELKF